VYAWILKSMKDVEPRWDMSKLRIIFGDQHVSTVLLQKLNIQESCTLRGDYYHIYNKVWPKGFCQHFESIKHYLKAMLESKSVEEWDTPFCRARQAL
jgi:hypothetical protein